MLNDYVRKIHQALQVRKENTILVNKFMLTKEDIQLIRKLAKIYNKTVIFGSSHDVIFNNDDNIYIVD